MQMQAQMYPERYFAVQLRFAQKVAEVAQMPLAEAVLNYTAIYRILGLKGQFDASHPDWQAYIQGLQGTDQDAAWTYQVYLSCYPRILKFMDEPHWDCFTYDYRPDRLAIRLHFSNQDASRCFPYQVLVTEGALQDFFEFYGV